MEPASRSPIESGTGQKPGPWKTASWLVVPTILLLLFTDHWVVASILWVAIVLLTVQYGLVRVRGTLRIPGTAIFLTSNAEGAPPALLHYLKHHKVLHEKVVLLSIQTHHVPDISPADRIEHLSDLGLGVYQAIAAYGFMQTPNVLDVLEACRKKGLETAANDTSYFLGRETLVLTERRGMAFWRKTLFAFLSRNARPATAFFAIPPDRVVEIGMQIPL